MIQNNINSENRLNKEFSSSSFSSEYIRAHLIISGKVQGVYFRKHTCDVSIQNHNGSVECILEGSKSNVDKVIRWCHQGPPNSRVDKVEIKYETFIGNFTDFKIAE